MPAEQLQSSMMAERQPGRRVRVLGCCLPIPPALGLLSLGSLALRIKRTRRAPAQLPLTVLAPGTFAQESFLGSPQGPPSTTIWATSATGRREDLAADRMRW
jgi:hypothetical protein